MSADMVQLAPGGCFQAADSGVGVFHATPDSRDLAKALVNLRNVLALLAAAAALLVILGKA